MNTEHLIEKWVAFFERISAQGNLDVFFAGLINLYSKPRRPYHNLTHIANCLNEFKPVYYLCEHPDEVEFALWYHDAVYDTQSKDSEERSAQLAYDICKEMGLPDSFGQRVRELILATKHKEIPIGIDAQVLTDVDLCILGKSEEEFDKSEKAIREEYNWVKDEQFRAGRVAIIQGFLDRPYIYSTKFFREKYETQARKNLKRSLARLGAKPL